MDILASYTLIDLTCIALVLVLAGMNKGGFPAGLIATPLLILLWPEQSQPARAAVGFMLPMLCLMDLFAFVIYRHEIKWERLRPLWLGGLIGIAVASALFVSDKNTLISVSDSTLKICIGVLGIVFVSYFAVNKLILKKLDNSLQPGWGIGSLFGFFAGLTSTLAHAAAPVMQMYLLPQHLPKKQYVGTNCAFFLS